MTIKKAAHVSDERAQEIINRAASQGRKLRQDEKAKISAMNRCQRREIARL